MLRLNFFAKYNVTERHEQTRVFEILSAIFLSVLNEVLEFYSSNHWHVRIARVCSQNSVFRSVKVIYDGQTMFEFHEHESVKFSLFLMWMRHCSVYNKIFLGVAFSTCQISKNGSFGSDIYWISVIFEILPVNERLFILAATWRSVLLISIFQIW